MSVSPPLSSNSHCPEAARQSKHGFPQAVTIHLGCHVTLRKDATQRAGTKWATYHNSQGLQDVEFAHGAGAVFAEPGVHAGFVEHVPVKKDSCVRNATPYHTQNKKPVSNLC